MITCSCDNCGYATTMEKAWGGKGRAFALPRGWLTTKNGIACKIECYQILKRKGKPPCLPKPPPPKT